jgi:hypothetical protein
MKDSVSRLSDAPAATSAGRAAGVDPGWRRAVSRRRDGRARSDCRFSAIVSARRSKHRERIDQALAGSRRTSGSASRVPGGSARGGTKRLGQMLAHGRERLGRLAHPAGADREGWSEGAVSQSGQRTARILWTSLVPGLAAKEVRFSAGRAAGVRGSRLRAGADAGRTRPQLRAQEQSGSTGRDRADGAAKIGRQAHASRDLVGHSQGRRSAVTTTRPRADHRDPGEREVPVLRPDGRALPAAQLPGGPTPWKIVPQQNHTQQTSLH